MTLCGLRSSLPKQRRRRILLTNGHFPVCLDLARQLDKAGHTVYVVDAMQYHVCAFSIAVKQSRQVPSPYDDAKGHIGGVMAAVKKWKTDKTVPVHEEIFFLAECTEREILDRLLAPPFNLLVRLHNKWEFTKLMQRISLDVPEAQLCTSYGDVKRLPVDRYEHRLALKPCFGRASTGVHHLKSGEPLPKSQDTDVGDHNHHIAQEWTKGDRYCSSCVVRVSKIQALGLYPALDTLDGSFSVFFKQVQHPAIEEYVTQFVERCSALCGPFSGQFAFGFVADTANKRLITMECNPRSTFGVHLWSRTPHLAYALTSTLPEKEDLPMQPPMTKFTERPSHMQVSAGMMICRDLMPTITQAFLLKTCYSLCKKAGLQLPELFQLQVLWETKGEHLAEVRERMREADKRDRERMKQLAQDGAGWTHNEKSA